MQTPFILDSARFLNQLRQLRQCFELVVAETRIATRGADRDGGAMAGRPGGGGGTVAARAGSPRTGVDAGVSVGAALSGAPAAGTADRQPDVPPSVVDEPGRLSWELFGCSCWSALVTTAAFCADDALVAAAREFLARTENGVRAKGLTVWLYELVNDARMALVMDEPSPRMPPTIRPMGLARMVRWLRGSGRGRFGSRTRQEDMAEYATQAHRLAALVLLQWGSPHRIVNEMAATLLTDASLGSCLLREDPAVRARGASTDTRYRRLVDYRRRLCVEGDFQYARAVAAGMVPLGQEDERCELTFDVDRRYLYDAAYLLQACEDLWEGPEVPAAAQVAATVESKRKHPIGEVRRNPLYLRDLAESLLGPTGAEDLVQGFERRDRERFAAGRRRLEEQCEMVQETNLLMVPLQVVQRAEPDWDALGRAPWQQRTEAWCSYGVACDDAATIVLTRMHFKDDAFRAQAAMGLLRQLPGDYCDVVLPVIEREISRLAVAA
ncbi:hypothetical protein [Bifidobacterium cuniculi]|uniref:Riboflavin-specific deaminase n=1 Tax=Bifidobacterium cuniculi TaxID=1688 RepID=A0A087AZR7_9BIFI|nr:hypothetical protein [Bifidobacterium cuniculi]KFI64267.1 riboflavin-specific deaminase [Bifidobacterium cuniculi]